MFPLFTLMVFTSLTSVLFLPEPDFFFKQEQKVTNPIHGSARVWTHLGHAIDCFEHNAVSVHSPLASSASTTLA